MKVRGIYKRPRGKPEESRVVIVNRSESVHQGISAMSGNISGCHNYGGGGTAGLQWVEARDATQQPTMHRTTTHAYIKELSSPKLSTAPKLKNPDPKKFHPGKTHQNFYVYSQDPTHAVGWP